MQRDLKRKEYGAFLSILGWASAKTRKFINLAKTFDGFEPSQLIRVELTTLLGLCFSRYSSVVAQLRKVQNITQQLVEQLIKENRPARKPKQNPISGWKQNRSGGGRRYEVILHDEETGLSIEHQAEAEGVLPQKVIAEAVALREKRKSSSFVQVNEYTAAQLEEFKDVVDQARSLDTENRKLMYQLQQREFRVAELEARLGEGVAASSTEPNDVQEHAQLRTEEVEKLPPTAITFFESQQPINDALAALAPESINEAAIAPVEIEQYLEEQAQTITVLPEAVLAGENRTEIQWLINAPIDQVEQVIHEMPVGSTYRALYLMNRFQSGDQKRMELLEQQVTEHHIAIGVVKPTDAVASEQVTEYSSQEAEVTDYLEPEQESEYLEAVEEDDIFLEADEVSNCNLEESLDTEHLKKSDLVEINVTRLNGDKTWNGLRGYIQQETTSTGKIVVLLQGNYRSKQFFKNELKVVKPVETEIKPQVFQKGDRAKAVLFNSGSDELKTE